VNSTEGKDGLPTFFHAGETHDRDCQNLHDSILLGTKRIGHGFQLFLFPYLQDLVKEKDICIEVCPLSNMVLGYTKDLRTHPVSVMLSKGIQASISSDDPGLFGYEGVTLDYVYAAGAWMLDLRDLKKLSLNGIKYASISEEKKKFYYEEIFP
jgi:adenosine deaminase CECR1